MDEQINVQKKSPTGFIITIAVLVVGVIIGYAVGVSGGGASAEVQKLQAQIEKAKKFFPAVDDMRVVSGTVKEINGNVVKIETSEFANPFENIPTSREIVITDATKLVRQKLKSPSVFNQEWEDYQKAIEGTKKDPALGSSMAAPMPFEELEISLDQIIQGDSISVEASENIKEKARFDASKIILQPDSNELGAPPAEDININEE